MSQATNHLCSHLSERGSESLGEPLHPVGRGASSQTIESRHCVHRCVSLRMGETCMSQVGVWWPPHTSLHINILELLTVWKVVQHFAHLNQDAHVLIHMDKVAAAYINHGEGVRSTQLLDTARQLVLWAHRHMHSSEQFTCPVF